MSHTLTIAKKEIKSYFTSPAAYVVLVAFLVIIGWIYTRDLFLAGRADLRSMFDIINVIFPIFIPAITMGLIAREKSLGTIETLSTLPLSESQIILGKFTAAMFLISTGLLFTLIHLITISVLGNNVDFGQIFCGYLGLFLVSAVYTSIGIFASSMAVNQIVAFLIAFVISFFFWIIGKFLIFLPHSMTGLFQYISLDYHLANISRGVIDTRNIIYFASLIILFLKTSIIALQSRKW